MGLYDLSFYQIIERNALCFKDNPAWCEVEDGRTLTFEQYKDKVDKLATGLQKIGVQKGDRIGVLAQNSLEFFLLYGAASAIGAIVLPINWRLSPEEVAFNLNDCEPRLVFSDESFSATIEQVKGDLRTVEQFYNLGPSGTFEPFESLLEKGDDLERADVAWDDGFVIIHTAAVAGRPRGALISHGNVLCADMHFALFFGIGPKDVHLNLLPLFHVGGLFMATTAFHFGALNVNMRKFDALQATRLIEEKKVTFMMVFSPILASILDEHEKTGADISTLQSVTGLDTPETIERYQKLTGGKFYSMYGQTETSCLATFSAYDERPGSAGRPLPLAEVRLVDAHDKVVEVGEVGEITLRGPMVFKGYWNLPKDNEYTFRDGWHHTGDLGRFDEDGFLWYAGRKAEKELIKPGGENVYPAEVEKVILQHPSVEKVVVFGVPDPKWKEAIKAVCQLKEGATLEAQELIEFVGQRIARYKKPKYVEFVAQIPMLEDGTPDRDKVKELYSIT